MSKVFPLKWKKQFPEEFDPESSAIQVFFLSLESEPETYQYFLNLLDEEEIERAKGFYFEKDKNQFVVLRGSLKCLIKKYLNSENIVVSLGYGENGKPFLGADLAKPSLHFNVSHSQNHALIALSFKHEIGVDLEKIDSLRKWKDILKKNFDESENKYVFEVPDEHERLQRFYRLWTLKEAIVKCEGKGLLTSLESIHLPTDQFSSEECSYQNLSLIHFQCPIPEYVASLATFSKDFTIDAYQISSELLSH